MNLTYQIDVDHVFDSEGVLKKCADYVISNDMFCWSPPADNPKRVSCDVGQTTTTTTTAVKTCEDYFGDVSDLVTVVDPTLGVPGKTDGSGEYCDANNVARPCSFIHYAGLKTQCANPAPPDAVHRYQKVTYSHKCRRVLERMNLTFQVDVDHVFDSRGVLKQCADHVLRIDTSCWAPPSEDPQKAACDLEESMLQSTTTTTTVVKTCEDYFGDVSDVVTVVDPTLGVPGKTDGSGEYCDANNVARPCSFIHYAGLKTQCGNPAPPDATHRYHKVTYSHKCRQVLQALNLTWQVDVDHVFDSQGVLKQCTDYVQRIDVSCWAPPAEDPQQAACDVEDAGILVV